MYRWSNLSNQLNNRLKSGVTTAFCFEKSNTRFVKNNGNAFGSLFEFQGIFYNFASLSINFTEYRAQSPFTDDNSAIYI